jgi:hypothetical protein
MNDMIPRLAAIPFAQDAAVDRILEDVTRTLVRRGIAVAGFLQHAEHVGGQCCGAVDVEDIATGERIRIMQALGKHARGCRLDPQAMADVSMRAMRALEDGPKILVLNRFGKGEAEGAGLRAVFEAAAVSGIPLLTSVKESYLPAWNDFAAGFSARLDADTEQALSWCFDAAGVQREVGCAA